MNYIVDVFLGEYFMGIFYYINITTEICVNTVMVTFIPGTCQHVSDMCTLILVTFLCYKFDTK